MAVAFKGRICHLLSELFADTFVFFLFLSATGTVAAGAAKPLFYRLYDFFGGIKCYFHFQFPSNAFRYILSVASFIAPMRVVYIFPFASINVVCGIDETLYALAALSFVSKYTGNV